jgi:hypothetical protein
MALGIELTSSLSKKKHRHPSAAIHWEVIADKLNKAGWSWGCVAAIDSNGRTIWIADVHRDDSSRRATVRNRPLRLQATEVASASLS